MKSTEVKQAAYVWFTKVKTFYLNDDYIYKKMP